MELVSVLLICATGGASAWLHGSWLAPAPLLAAYWAIAILVPLIVAPDYAYSAGALLYICGLVAMFGIGSIFAMPLGRTELPGNTGPRRPVRLHSAGISYLSLIGTIAVLAATTLTLLESGFSPADVLSPSGLLEAGNTISVNRYASGADGGGASVAILLTLGYSATLAAPFSRLTERRRWYVRHGPLLALLAYSAVSTQRLALLIGVSLGVAAELTVYMLAEGRPPRVTAQQILRLVAGLLLVAVAFSAIAFIRVGRYDSEIRPVIEDKLRGYAIGYLSAYSQWFDEQAALGWPPAAVYETPSIALRDHLRDNTRAQGATRANNDFRMLGGEGLTNIYTIVRSLINDFGWAGALLIAMAVGFLATRWFAAVCMRGSVPASAGLAVLFGTVLLGVVLSILSFSNVCGAAVIGSAIVVLSERGRWRAINPTVAQGPW